MNTLLEEIEFQTVSEMERWFINERGVPQHVAVAAAPQLFPQITLSSDLIGQSAAILKLLGVTGTDEHGGEHALTLSECLKFQQIMGEISRNIYASSVFSKIEEVWDFKDYGFDDPDEEFQGCFKNIRRNETPDCYRDLTDAVSSEFDTAKHHIVKYTKKSTASSVSTRTIRSVGGTETHTITNRTSIYDHASRTYSRAHMIGKDPACAFFQGKPAEGALGINLDQDKNAGLKHQLLVYGVEEYQDQFGKIVQATQGLRDRKEENMVVMNARRDDNMDNLKKGNIVVLPIYTLRECKEWQQGISYDLLIVASNEEGYDWMAINASSKGISRASPDKIDRATTLANDFIEGLLDLTLHDTIPAVPETPEDANNEERKVLTRMKSKRDHMEHIQHHIRKNKTVKLPEQQKEIGKPVLKISLGDWPFDKYPDPYLVGLKGAINLYFEGSGILKHKLRPACPTESSEDSSSSSVAGVPGWRTLFSFLPTDVNVATDDDSDNVSVLSDIE